MCYIRLCYIRLCYIRLCYIRLCYIRLYYIRLYYIRWWVCRFELDNEILIHVLSIHAWQWYCDACGITVSSLVASFVKIDFVDTSIVRFYKINFRQLLLIHLSINHLTSGGNEDTFFSDFLKLMIQCLLTIVLHQWHFLNGKSTNLNVCLYVSFCVICIKLVNVRNLNT